MKESIAALHFAPLLPPWLLAVLAALCVLALAPALWRRARGAAWRAAVFAVLLLWLAGPQLVRETRQGLPDIGLLVVDQTASMQVGHRAALAEAARQRIQAEAARLPGLELRTVTVPEAGSEGTRLFAAIDRALADIPRSRLAGVVAITDGQAADVPAHPAAGPGGAPLNVLIPARGEETDRVLKVIEAPSWGIVGKPVRLKVAVEDLGVAHPAAAARLTVRRDGEPPMELSVPVGAPTTIQVPITRPGPTVVELTAAPLPGEVSTLNNRAVVQINGVRDRLRVLLVSGEPHAGERTWRRLLKADPSVDLVHFTILRPPEKDDNTPLNELALIAFPVRELFLTKLDEFDLIILDRFQNRGLLPAPYFGNIADHIRAGGALLVSVGPEFASGASLYDTPLGPILPARPLPGGAPIDTPFRPEITPLGARHPVTAGLPGGTPLDHPSWGSWYRYIPATKLRGETVMDAPGGDPLLILDRVGKGRVALLLSDQIWLWSRGHQGGGPQAELLRRLAHWLMQEPALEENALTARVRDGRLTIARRSTEAVPAGGVPVTVTAPDGSTIRLTLSRTAPGLAEASLPAATPGVWQVNDGTRTSFAAADAADPPELADLRATATRLAPVVRASHGGVHWLDDGTAGGRVPALLRIEAGRSASGAGWIGFERRHDHIVTGIDSLPLLPAWAALTLMLGLIVIAWRREGA